MDREKVIKGWECHMEADTLGCADCPYRQGWRTCNFADTLFNDVYAMLKEQEDLGTELTNAVELIRKKNERIEKLLKEQEAKEVEAEVINEIDRLYRCPSCHISMILRKQPYCHSCGQAVKWE